MEEKEKTLGECVGECEGSGGSGFVKSAVLFLGFFVLAIAYYLMIDYVMMVFAQNLPFPYKG